MAIFTITGQHPITGEQKIMYYDSSVSTLKWEDDTNVLLQVNKQPPTVTPAKINKGKSDLSVIKIQLGLSCNFECEYCSQRFVPHADSTNPNDVNPFVENMSTWYKGGEDGLGKGTKFEFWGGEPFVYWKTFKPLADAIHEKYPNSEFLVITNGSMFDIEKNEWLDHHNFMVAISHDGPGQPVRGPDPLDDPKSKEAIIDLYKRLAPKGRISLNSMINSNNISRANIESFFKDFISKEIGEQYLQYLVIGEGGFVDAYDEGGMANSLLDEEQELKYRNSALNELRAGQVKNFFTINTKVTNFINTINKGTRIESLGQKCGMDRSDNIAVDLNGNVLTCQNVSPVSTNPAGISHHIGHVSDLASVEVKTSTHWSDREECPKCPVLHLCHGSCMFLSGKYWEASCNNAFSDNIVPFVISIEEMTGLVVSYIEGPQREDRKDIFWWVNGKPENTRKAKKIIPITAM